MNEHQLLELIRKGEGISIEFKTSRNQLNRDIYKTVCAFLNRHGVLDPATFTPYPKNPVIGAFFREIHRADELGSGMMLSVDPEDIRKKGRANNLSYAKGLICYLGGCPTIPFCDVFAIVSN